MKLEDTYKIITAEDGTESYIFEDGKSFAELGDAVAYAQEKFDIKTDIDNLLMKEF